MPKPRKTPAFFCMPYRMLNDGQCTCAHWKALGAISAHDRLSNRKGKGQGAWASHETMAKECGLKYGTFSEAVSDLLRWGYIIRERREQNRRQYTYRVICDDSSVVAEQNSSTNSEQCAASDSSATAPDSSAADATIVRRQNEETQSDQADASHNKKRKEDSVETGKEDSAEAASLRDAWLRNGNGKTVGAYLARLERRLKEQGDFAQIDAGTQEYIEALAEEEDRDNPLIQQARRILDTWGVAP